MKKHIIRKHPSGALLLLALSTCLAACDDSKKSESAATSDTKAQASIPEVTPPPSVPVAEPIVEKAPKKTLDDCAKDKLVIENADLEASIRLKAQKPEGELTVSDLKKLRSLNLSRVDLPALDICLFTHMSELRELFLGPSGIDDLSAIANSTKMETLGIARNPITDLGPLSGMTKLDRLDLAKTKVKDLAPIQHAVLMTELTLDETEVEDLSALAQMTKLERVSLKGTQIKDISVLAPLKSLKFLYIADSQVDLGQTGVLAQNGTKIVQD